MLKKITLLTFLITALGMTVFAQSSAPWTLEQCINYATDNSLTIKQARNGIEIASVNDLGNRMQRLPQLNARIGYGYQFGYTINPVTNTFESLSIGGGSSGISGGVLLYNGGVINNSIKQGRYDLEAAKLDAKATVNNIALQIAAAYLNILLSEEQLANAQKQEELSSVQLRRTDRLIEAGSLPANDRLDLVAQLALNEQAVIEAQNQVEINYLNLVNLLELDPNQDFSIARPEITVPDDANPEIFSTQEVYTAALSTQPQIEADEFRLRSAALQEKITRANGMPSLSLSGSLSTSYSTQSFMNQDFIDQLNNNFGQSIGFNLNIPIYNNHTTRVGIERARVNMNNVSLTNQLNRQQLKADVQQSIANARAARESYQAGQRSVDAAQTAFENAQKRFDLGAINAFEYTTAANNLDQAKVSLIQAKYQYYFNLKVVDFYLGRELEIN